MFTDPNRYAHLSDDSAMLQAALDEAVMTGKTMHVPKINARTGKDVWVLDRAVILRSGSTVWLDKCHLRLTDGAFDNIFKTEYARTEAAGLIENRVYDIHIYGTGGAVLDGGNHNGMTERNNANSDEPKFDHVSLENTMIHVQNAERITIENLRIVNARYWGMTFHYCTYGRVSNINFMSCGHCPNNDGIDLRLGCCDFIIENITGYTQDDSVALTCLDDKVARIKGVDDSIHGVIIRNIATGTRCANVRLLNHYGRKLYNIVIENVQSSVETDPVYAYGYDFRLPDAEKVTWAVSEPYWSDFEDGKRRGHVCVKIGENGYYNPDKPNSNAKLGDTFNITVRNVQACNMLGVSIARTLSNSSIENIQMFGRSAIGVFVGKGEYEDVDISKVRFAKNARPEDGDMKPRGGNYGYEKLATVVFNSADENAFTLSQIGVHPTTGEKVSNAK